ncbi:MAG: L-2-amino-thiazoline-4-carboxylic acid hydrolase [Deltaproteobacteria bacterium]|nr:L-2-amino-thiazoline-4-carboxylic acid hydrolase [Deltaproteobacteria bacterium]
MEKVAGKDIPVEKQRDLLIAQNALKLPLLHQNLIETYGNEKGEAIYRDLFESNFKKRIKIFEGKDIGDIMMYEIDMFPVNGWKIWIEKGEENGEPVWYEHLERCPHLEATRKRNLPDPCPIICDMDCILGEKYKVAKWERKKHLPAGDSECCFRITRAR